MKSFCRLKFGEKFEINGMKYQKETLFSAVRCHGPANRSLVLLSPFELVPFRLVPFRLNFWPWSKVRTCELVRDALPGGLSSADSKLMRKLPTYLDRALTQKHKDDERTGPSC